MDGDQPPWIDGFGHPLKVFEVGVAGGMHDRQWYRMGLQEFAELEAGGLLKVAGPHRPNRRGPIKTGRLA